MHRSLFVRLLYRLPLVLYELSRRLVWIGLLSAVAVMNRTLNQLHQLRVSRKRKRKLDLTPEDSDALTFIDEEDEQQRMMVPRPGSSRLAPLASSSSCSSLLPSPYLVNGWPTKHKPNNTALPSLSDNNNPAAHANEVAESTAAAAAAATAAGHGSPLRSSLNLQLRSHTSAKLPVQECPMCPYSSDSPGRLEEHINRQHFDLTSPSLPAQSPSARPDRNFNCPFCCTAFQNPSDLELHVNIEHKDILSPAKPSTGQKVQDEEEEPSSSGSSCPVCLLSEFATSAELQAHIEGHFGMTCASPPDEQLPSCADRLLARDIQRREREARRAREQKEFALLQAQYGMDNQGNFREQSVTNMQRAVYAGEMSVADYYEKQIELRAAESCGVDDASSCTRGLVGKVRPVSHAAGHVLETRMCSSVDHYAVSYGDRGWGCGYRNLQMLISSLLQHTGYNELVYRAWAGSAEQPPRTAVPSISKLQHMIECAWAQGFDEQGADQLGAKLINTRKWIGATEVVTLLSSLRIRCQLLDFHRPTSSDGSHPELFAWVLRYFQQHDDFKPPLYLQHQGHSRTIMGVEQLRDGSTIMLVLDPSHSPTQMAQFNSTSSASAAMRLVRISIAAMKARQYQIVAVIGTIDSELQYQQSKVLRSVRIPQDR